MSIPFKRSFKKYCFFGILFFLTTVLYSQNSSINKENNELTLINKLDNGLEYVIDNTSSNSNYTVLKLVVNVGAIHEENNEIGYAHFLEHIAFGSGKRFPKNSFINFLTQKGLEVGKHYNAVTNHDNTIFTIKLTKEASLTDIYTTLLFFADIIDGLSLKDEEIEKQKSIILQELYSRQNQSNDFLFYLGNSIYAHRNIIGSEQNIKNCNSEKLNLFYKKNYTTLNAGIFISSSHKSKQIENQIRSVFNSKKKITNETENKTNLFESLSFTSKNITSSTNEKELILNWPSKIHKYNNAENYKQNFCYYVIGKILEDRLSRVFPNISFSFRRNYFLSNVFHNSLTVRHSNKTKDILKIVLQELTILSSYGISEKEFKYYKNWYTKRIEKKYNQLKNSVNTLDFYTSLFKTQQNLITVKTEESINKTILSKIRHEVIKKTAATLLKSSRIIVENSTPDNAKKITLKDFELIREDLNNVSLKNKEVLPLEINKKIISEKKSNALELTIPELKIQSHIQFFTDSILNITHISYKNGVNIYIKNIKTTEPVQLIGKASGGLSLISNKDYSKYESTSSYIDLLGISNLNYNQSQEYLSNKDFGVSTTVSEFERNIYGYTNNQNLKEFFKFLFSKMMLVNTNSSEFDSVMNEEIKNFSSEKNAISLWDSYNSKVAELTNNYFPKRNSPQSIEELKSIKLKNIVSFYNTCFQNASDWSFYITGNVNINEIQKLTAMYLANIPSDLSLKPKRKFDYTKFDDQYKLKSTSDSKLTSNTIILYGTYKPKIKDNITLEIIEKLIRFAVTEQLREKNRLVYTPSVKIEKNKHISPALFTIQISYDCLKEDVKKSKNITLKIIKNLTKNKISLNDLNFSKKAVINTHKEILKSNNVYLWSNYLEHQINTKEDSFNLNKIVEIINTITSKDVSNFLIKKIDLKNIKIVQNE